MKIVHICFASVYKRNTGYQENMLVKYHMDFGNEVVVLSEMPKEIDTWGADCCSGETEVVEYLPYRKRFGWYSKYLNDIDGVFEELNWIRPDVIFVHGGQTIALKQIRRYVRRYKDVRLFIDNHADHYNMVIASYRSWILQHLIFGHQIRSISKYTEKFWGVTPWRCQYLREVYHVPAEKVDLLLMGGDDDSIDFDNRKTVRESIRLQHRISDNDFVVVTGGHIDLAKNIHLLVDAINQVQLPCVKLIVFGSISDEVKEIINVESSDRIKYIGWIPSDKVYNYFLASDLAVFPGTHSVLWEQACATGLPGVFKHWEGMHHVDVGGNAVFLYKDSSEEIIQVVRDIVVNRDKYQQMLEVARAVCPKLFSYREIAKKAIGYQE